MNFSQSDIKHIETEMKELLQVSNDQQLLDSLEVTVIKSYLNSRQLDANQMCPTEHTIKGWIKCLHQYLINGEAASTN